MHHHCVCTHNCNSLARPAGFCNGTYGHVYHELGIPFTTVSGSPGRLRAPGCQPKRDHSGQQNQRWGKMENDLIFGQQGWCNAPLNVLERPDKQPLLAQCHCNVYEQFTGSKSCFWREHGQAFCVNQCSGNGLCFFGFCMCFAGWCACGRFCCVADFLVLHNTLPALHDNGVPTQLALFLLLYRGELCKSQCSSPPFWASRISSQSA